MSTKSTARKSSASSKPRPDAGNPDAIALLEADHREVEYLFDQFSKAAETSEKGALARAICLALKVHSALEEELFYPAAMEATGESGLLQEALVEHAAAKDLIAQIETGSPGEPFYDARVTVLGEYVSHHVQEEEGELFPKCRESRMDLQALGELMTLRKLALLAGTPAPSPLLPQT